VQVASHGQSKAGKTNVDAYDQLVGRVKACHPDDDVEVLGPVGRVSIAKDRAGRPVAFAYLGDGLIAVQTDVAIVAGLAGRREIDSTDTRREHLLVANAWLAVVLGVEVVDDKDGLVGVCGRRVYLDRREEDDPIPALEIYCLELFLDVDVAGPIVVAQILPLSGSDLVPLGRPTMEIGSVLGRDEVEAEVALGGLGPRGAGEAAQSPDERAEAHEHSPRERGKETPERNSRQFLRLT
jgi:hypothetical protein